LLTARIEKEINIYVGLTEMQRKWYRSVLEKDIDAVNGGHILSGMKTPIDRASRVDRKEGRQDTADEHGHAIAKGRLSPVPVRRGCTL